MRKLILLTVTVIALVLIVGTVAWAQASATLGSNHALGARLANTPLGRLIAGHIGRALVLKSELNLSDTQRQQVRDILAKHKTELAAAIKPIVEKRRALRDAVTAPTPDDQAIRAASTDLGKAIGDAAVVGARLRGELAKILSPDQLKRVQQFRADNDHAMDDFLKDLGGNP